MALFVQLVKYSPAGAKGHLDGGFEERVQVARTALESVGGKLKGYWMTEGGEWHALQLFEFPDSSGQAVRAGFQLAASGAIEDYKVLRLVDPSEVDAAGALDYRPPVE